MTNIAQLLGDKADSLLNFKNPKNRKGTVARSRTGLY
jgi:hypothetical protein